MKTISFSNINKLGISLLTGEACAFSMRVLCDLNQSGADLLRDYLGLPPDAALNKPWNSQVDGQESVASMMLVANSLPDLMRFALFRQGFQYVYDSLNSVCGFNASDFDRYPGLRELYVDAPKPLAHGQLHINPRNPAASVGTRNVHQMTDRVS